MTGKTIVYNGSENEVYVHGIPHAFPRGAEVSVTDDEAKILLQISGFTEKRKIKAETKKGEGTK